MDRLIEFDDPTPRTCLVRILVSFCPGSASPISVGTQYTFWMKTCEPV